MYWDILTRIKNGLAREYGRVKVPYSKFNMHILETLAKAGYIDSASRKGRGVRRIIEIKLKYDESGKPAIHGLRFISKPSRRLYTGYKDIKTSHQGYGNFVLSTPQGILTDNEARKRKIGGQILFEIW